MFNLIEVDGYNAAVMLCISLLLIALGCLLFNFIWLTKNDFHFPRGNYRAHVDDYDQENDTMVAKDIQSYVRTMWLIIKNLDHEYWIRYAGFDVFQRTLLRAILFYGVGNLIFFLIAYIIIKTFDGNADIERILATPKYVGVTDFYVCVNLFMLTSSVLFSLLNMRRHLQATFYYSHAKANEEKGLNWLKLRTIEIESSKELSLNSAQLTQYVQRVLNNRADGKASGRVLSCVVIPDLAELLEIEIERHEAFIGHQFFMEHLPFLKFLWPSALQTRSAYDKHKKRLEISADKALTRKTRGSLELAYFRTTFLRKIGQDATLLIRDLHTTEGQDEPEQHLRKSIVVDLSETPTQKSSSSLEVELRVFPHPSDINWRNVKRRTTSLSTLWRLVLLAVSAVIILFLTTPWALWQIIDKNTALHAVISKWWYKWAADDRSHVAMLMKSLLPTLMIILVNQILLLIITYLVFWENSQRFSFYQASVLKFSFLYLLFNMLIMQGVASTFSNLFDLLTAGLQTGTTLYEKLFERRNGDVFITLILTSAAASLFFSLTSFTDVIIHYFSPGYFMATRNVSPDKNYLMKNDGTIFPYGYNYAQELVILGIAFVFHSSIWQVTWATIFYLVCRHIGDVHQILIWHRLEIESSGNLLDISFRRLTILLLLTQGYVLVKQIFNGTALSIVFCLAMLAGSATFYYYLSQRPLISPEKFPDDTKPEERFGTQDRNMLEKSIMAGWFNNYKHPLVVGVKPLTPQQDIGNICRRSSNLDAASFVDLHQTKDDPLLTTNKYEFQPSLDRLGMRDSMIGLSPKYKPNRYQPLED